MRLKSSLVLALAMAAGVSFFVLNNSSSATAAEPTLRYGSPELAQSNGLSSKEFIKRYIELRDQGEVPSSPAPSIGASSISNPPSVTETLAAATNDYVGSVALFIEGNPVQSTGPGENIFMAWLDDRDVASNPGIYFTRSTDGGATWDTAQRVDRTSSAAGTAGIGLNITSDNHGTVVLIWDDFRNETDGQMFVNVSHDNGATWSGEEVIDGGSRLPNIVFTDVVIDPSGHVLAVWTDARTGASTDIMTARSNDRGDSFSQEVRVNDVTGNTDVDVTAVATRDSDFVVSWKSDRFGNGDYYAARSVDNGATWTADTRLNQNAQGTLTPYMGSMCSDGHGTIYRFMGLITGPGGDAYVRVSNDFGATWQPWDKIAGAHFNQFLGGGMLTGACSFDGATSHGVVAFSGSTNTSDVDDIFASTSSDNGLTWSSADRMNLGVAAGAGNFIRGLLTGIDSFGHIIVVWTDSRSGAQDAYLNYSNDYGATFASTDVRINGGTPGMHDVSLGDNTAVSIVNYPNGSDGGTNADRLAFDVIYFDDRAGDEGMYHNRLSFDGEFAGVNRLAGADRIATSIATNQDIFPTDGTCPAIVIATSGAFPDGLSAGPLAAMLNGGLLLNPSSELDSDVGTEIQRCLDLKAGPAKNVYVTGGTSAISDGVISAIQGLSGHIRIKRVSGANRYETSVRIAEEMDRIRAHGPSEAMIASGENFPDALSASAPASDAALNPDQMPILLVRRTSVDAIVSAYLSNSSATLATAHIIGGTAAVNDAVLATVDATVLTVDRIAGADRYATAAAVANQFYPLGAPLSAQSVGIASGKKFPDSLGGGRASGFKHRPLLLVTESSVPTPTSDYISDNAGTLTSADVYGGTSVISDAVLATISGLL